MAEAALQHEKSWCTTEIPSITISFTWTIKNFSFIIKDEEDKLTSSCFSSDRASNDIKWYLTIRKSSKNYLSVSLCSSSAAKSATFANTIARFCGNMFSHKMMEEDKGEVKIQDVDKDVLREVLHFIYTGKTKNLNIMAEFVLPVADKYDVQGLKEECEIVLAGAIAIENAAELLILADFHKATQLKAKILDFVKWNSDAVMKTPDWNTLIRSNSDLINEVIAVFSQLTVK